MDPRYSSIGEFFSARLQTLASLQDPLLDGLIEMAIEENFLLLSDQKLILRTKKIHIRL